jgi:hypothetical protein
MLGSWSSGLEKPADQTVRLAVLVAVAKRLGSARGFEGARWRLRAGEGSEGKVFVKVL